jgi:hypothetical protein
MAREGKKWVKLCVSWVKWANAILSSQLLSFFVFSVDVSENNTVKKNIDKKKWII